MSNLIESDGDDEFSSVRRVWNEDDERFYFAVVDVIEVLVETERARKYWNDLKTRVRKQAGIELSDFCGQFPMKHKKNGRTYQTDCADREGMFRIIQSIPSPKAEPIKRWLAQVANERIEEIENPALVLERMKETYRLKGYDDEWIEKRIQSIVIRNELTDEWDDRGVKKGLEYAILTAEISKGTFGITPSEHKKVKGLKRQNLRDHMTGLELVFNMLGEASTTEITRTNDAQGLDENKIAARQGGKIAGNARRELEAQTGEDVVSSDNFLSKPNDDQPKLLGDE